MLKKKLKKHSKKKEIQIIQPTSRRELPIGRLDDDIDICPDPVQDQINLKPRTTKQNTYKFKNKSSLAGAGEESRSGSGGSPASASRASRTSWMAQDAQKI